MLKIEKTEVVGWEASIRGMRNPMNSWEQSDSFICREEGEMTNDEIEAKCGKCPRDTKTCGIYDKDPHFIVGNNDHGLMEKLRNAGTDHRKFMRMLIVYLDITAPLYWWKEFDTYKVGTVANSCSTMHKIAAKEFTLEDFSCEHLLDEESLPPYEERADIDHCEPLAAIDVNGQWCYYTPKTFLNMTCHVLNHFRRLYLKTKDKKYWWQMIQLLPSSYNQKRTIMLSYEVLANIYKSRRNHKLDEWHTLCDWIEGLPYSEMITGGAEYLNKKITLPEADALAAYTLSKLQNSGDSPDKSKAILMEFYEKMRKDDTSTPPNDFKIVDEWNQYGHMEYLTLIGKRNGRTIFGHQEKGDTSDAKPE